ncbi:MULTISPECIES: FbpB family small basic protein [Bacillaceae]|uniref:FbpB family small basic protein n=1 Tax=Metabacillus herbersteinensis TaxID=283816 RepID=A0ABV6GJT1_9BACI|nr:FbpB family small basic protein [Cytobacillus oceanisediminis]
MKRKVSFVELVKKNKEDLLKDKKQVAKIEERLDARHVMPKK